MSDDRRRPRRRALVALVIVGVMTSGCAGARRIGAADRPAPSAPPRAATTETAPAIGGSVAPAPGAPAEQSASLAALRARQLAVPVRLEVDGTIDAPVVPVGVDPHSGDLAVPPSATTVAWFENGPAPGAPGSAVLAAHVDWHGQRGVFFTLHGLGVGAGITVTLGNGRRTRFTVVRRTEVAKNDLAATRVFSNAGPSQLVLITCGGDFDWQTHHYADNVVVYARPA